jgi:glycerol uptake facilitator-like aquaporin
MCVESVVVCLYICFVIVVPELLDVNRMSRSLLSIPIIPIMLLRVPDRGSAFNPAAQYALWYVYGRLTGEWYLQLEHIVAPIVGAVAAGLICSKFFPDDPTSWRKP